MNDRAPLPRLTPPGIPLGTSPGIPHYALYGDAAAPSWLGMVHVERIPERSSQHDFDIAAHVHDGLVQLLYLTAGGGELVVDGQRWPLRSPALVVVPAQHVHGFRFSRDVDGPVVTAAQRPLESLAAVAAPELLVHIRRPQVLAVARAPRQAEALAPLFDAIAREAHLHSGSALAAGSALLVALFVQVARIAQVLQQPAPAAAARSRQAQQVERFKALVDAHFRQRRPLGWYAQQLGISAGQLSRLCRGLLGSSSQAVLNARVLHEAERELVYSTLGIKQIAALLGFADEAYFGRFFRQHRGQTPTAFRAAAWAQLARPPA